VLYGILVALHVAFALFYALTIVCAVRGLGLWVLATTSGRDSILEPKPASVG
jgi:hypothetical protein